MAKYCAKHDIHGEHCWNCEEAELDTAEKREAAYSDPAFLAKRGGASRGEVIHNKALSKLASLDPDALERLIALANQGVKDPAAGGARVIARG
jgi:hypothetical protein